MAITTQITTDADIASILRTEWDASEFIRVLRQSLVIAPLARRDDIPRHSGMTVRWNLFNNPAADTGTNGAEGADPDDSTDFTTTAVTSTLLEYKGMTQFSKAVDLSTINGTRQEMVAGLAHKAAKSVDTLCFTKASVGLNAESTGIDAGVAMTADVLRRGVQNLLATDVEFHPATGGTAFVFVCSIEAAYDMMGEGNPAWFQVKDTDLASSLMSPFDGSPATSGLYNAIVKTSTNIQTLTTTSPDNDLNYLLGADAFGISSLESEVIRPTITITEPSQLVSAPARNRGTAAYWFLFTTAVLDSVRLEEIASDVTGVG